MKSPKLWKLNPKEDEEEEESDEIDIDSSSDSDSPPQKVKSLNPISWKPMEGTPKPKNETIAKKPHPKTPICTQVEW